jgi:hypothetical protein
MSTSPLRISLVAIALVALFVACTDSAEERARAAGGTPAPDGQGGYCCPAKTGGCALQGGYREEGACPTGFDICDNMCEQKIVKDAHGCDVLTYKNPPVTTTYAGTGSCSAPVFNGGDRDAGVDANDANDG